MKKLLKHDAITDQKKDKIHISFLKPLTIGLSFILILVAFTGWYQYFLSPDSYIYFDVNPGIKIVTNRQNQVIELIGINQEGKEIVESIDYRRKDLDLVQQQLLDQFMEKGILEDPRQVMLVSVLNKDQDKSLEVVQMFDRRIHEYFKNEDLKLVVLRQVLEKSNTLEEFAETYQVSMGKITFIRNLMILNPDFLLEELVELSLEKLLILSLETGLELDRVIDSDDDYEKIRIPDIDDKSEPKLEPNPEPKLEPNPEPKLEPKPEPKPEPKFEPRPTLGRLSVKKAIEIALGEVGGGVAVKFGYDYDDVEYEITIYFNGYEHEIEMDAYTGRIKEIDIDDFDDDDWNEGDPKMDELIGINGAKEIALGRVGGGRIEEIELEEEDGRFIYEVEVEYNGREYELEIDAYTGKILSFDTND
ncbi:PepSY domain-containing protein [Alkalicella caledoniensis]|uniref:PepSY domain-containing protein n=1 Tax=Alkalicella caledoniensis TaxID=2731377 RepID=A0A7G9W3M8_ALKCA|nr:PepSY domain-containing protein [Alkalicella caledoniensis]QNO13290.1 PepSY domain-containing protein [Alkalicella caledoniensis]